MKKILVVDDNRTNLTQIRKILAKYYEVACVLSGEEAIKYLEKINVDLILLDLNMPVLNGIETFKNILKNKELGKNVPVIFLTADSDVEKEVECLELGAADFILKPFVEHIMLSKISKHIELEEYRNNLEKIVNEKTQKIEEMQHTIIDVFANLIESRDEFTGRHVKRTKAYVRAVAKKLVEDGVYIEELTDEYIENLCRVSSLHDIGKISISDTILNKPARLTDEEFDIMKTHTTAGKIIIERSLSVVMEKREYVDMAQKIAMYHHEKWNGKGYPKGLKGVDIPLCARIMAVADVFDALVSKRCYKEPIAIDDAFKIIEESRGEHFEPVIADTFMNIRDIIERIIVEINE